MIIPNSRPVIDESDIEVDTEALTSDRVAQEEKVEELENTLTECIAKKYAFHASSRPARLRCWSDEANMANCARRTIS